MQPENNNPYLLRIQATKAARRKVILQVEQDVIVLTVGGQRAKYGAAKGIVDTAQLVYPWVTRDQVYASLFRCFRRICMSINPSVHPMQP